MESLVARGHRLEDILRTYTVDQVKAFVSAARRARLHDMYEYSIAMRVANQALGKDWKKYIDGLEKELEASNPVSRKAKKPKTITRDQAKELSALLGGKKRRKVKR